MSSIESIKQLTILMSGKPYLFSKIKKTPYMATRYGFMKLCKKYTDHSLEDIGNICGKRDHTTVIHGLRRFEDWSGQKFFEPYIELFNTMVKIIDSIGVNNISLIDADIINEARDSTYNEKMFVNHIIQNKRIKNTIDSKRKVHFLNKFILEKISILNDNDLVEFRELTNDFIKRKTA